MSKFFLIQYSNLDKNLTKADDINDTYSFTQFSRQTLSLNIMLQYIAMVFLISKIIIFEEVSFFQFCELEPISGTCGLGKGVEGPFKYDGNFEKPPLCQ